MSLKRTLFVFLIFLIVGGIYFLDLQLKQRKTAREEISQRPFPALDTEQIMALELTNEHGEFRLEKSGEQWLLAQPLRTKADQNAASQIISNLSGAKKSNIFSSANLQNYGLDQPLISVTLFQPQGAQQTLLIGSPSTHTGRLFATIKGTEEIFTVGEYLKNTLNKKLFDLRDRTILESSPLETTAFSLTNPSGELFAEKTEDNSWQLKKPSPYPADKTEVENLLRKLNLGRVKSFIDQPEHLDTYGLDTPQIAFTAQLRTAAAQQSSTPTVLLVGEQEEGSENYFAMRRGEARVFTIPKDVVEELQSSHLSLRDRTLFSLDQTEVGRISFTVGSQQFQLTRTDDEWQITPETSAPVDQQEVSSFLSSIINLKAKEFVDDNPEDWEQYGLKEPGGEFSIAKVDTSQQQGFSWGKREGGLLYIRKLNENSVLTLESKYAQDFTKNPDEFLDKQLLRFDAEQATRIEIQRPDQTLIVSKKDDQWWVERPDRQPTKVEFTKVDLLLQELLDLEFESVATTEELQTSSLDTPATTCTLSNQQGEVLTQLIIAPPGDDTVLVATGEDKIFFLPADDLESLTQHFRDLEQALQP